jgi:basic amino acid/polyamine antiporter, APA family
MQHNKAKKIGWISAGSIVVANMVGMGVFTTLGLQLENLKSTWTILLLWTLGGIFSLFGAFSYAEIGTRLPRSGGEYHFLSKIFHPFLGYLSGWVSLTVGFAASISLSAMAMGAYIGKFTVLDGKWIALGAILLISLIHSFDVHRSSFFQNLFTLLKVALIAMLIVFGLLIDPGENALEWSGDWQLELWKPSFAVALVYVIYAYSGWNAAAYIVDEIRAPSRNLPVALIGGTLLVTVLFILLQLSFLNQASLQQLSGKVEVGQVVAEEMFGARGGQLISFMIAFLLVAGISAMIWVGPRVTRAMAEDYEIWQFFARDNQWGVPVRAIWLQSTISVFMVVTSSFEQVLLYSGFILHLFTTITVAGLFVLRAQQGAGAAYKSPGYPWVQIIYLVFSVWILIFLLYDRPFESLMGLVNLALGAVSYLWSRWFARRYQRG